MSTPVALLNLAHSKARTCVSTLGVSLAIILMFMQLGFLGAVAATAVQIYDQLEFDVLLRSPDYFHFCDARDIPRDHLYRVASLPEVEWARPLYITLASWRIPSTDFTASRSAGELRGILALGMDPAMNVFRVPEIRRQVQALQNAETLLIDRKSKGSDYGAVDGTSFGDHDVNREVEVGEKRFRIAGHYALGAGLAANGSVLLSPEGFARFFPGDLQHRVHLGLVKLQPGVSADAFCERTRRRLDGIEPGSPGVNPSPGPVTILTRAEVRRLERDHWVWGTPVGSIFIIGVLVAVVVGSVVVYMVLSNDVAKQIQEYATLKAMGYSHRYLSGIVMQQAVILALLGYSASWCTAELLYRLIGRWANIPMQMTWEIRALVFVLSIGMCCLSGMATLRKLKHADPADLF